MESFNKIVSFILGLLVVVVLLAIISGRLDLKKRFLPSLKITNTTTTPSPFPTNKQVVERAVSPTPIKKTTYNRYQTTGASSIPNTGSPTLLLPIVFSSLLAGSYLRKKNK